MKASDKQIGGDHYRRYAISPFEFIERNGLSYAVGNVIKYVCRWREKHGDDLSTALEDLEKAKHYIDLLIELTQEHGFIARGQDDSSDSLEVLEAGNITITSNTGKSVYL